MKQGEVGCGNSIQNMFGFYSSSAWLLELPVGKPLTYVGLWRTCKEVNFNLIRGISKQRVLVVISKSLSYRATHARPVHKLPNM